jgi:hypothetical protein
LRESSLRSHHLVGRGRETQPSSPRPHGRRRCQQWSPAGKVVGPALEPLGSPALRSGRRSRSPSMRLVAKHLPSVHGHDASVGPLPGPHARRSELFPHRLATTMTRRDDGLRRRLLLPELRVPHPPPLEGRRWYRLRNSRTATTPSPLAPSLRPIARSGGYGCSTLIAVSPPTRGGVPTAPIGTCEARHSCGQPPNHGTSSA